MEMSGQLHTPAALPVGKESGHPLEGDCVGLMTQEGGDIRNQSPVSMRRQKSQVTCRATNQLTSGASYWRGAFWASEEYDPTGPGTLRC
jgi:hypothetical protein